MFESLYNLLHMSMLYVVRVSVFAVQPKKSPGRCCGPVFVNSPRLMFE